jgi:hypothetical protein
MRQENSGNSTLESAKRPSVTETTSFIFSTDEIRSLTACVCSAREASRMERMLSILPCAQSRYDVPIV